MAMIAPIGGKEFEKPPEGVHVGRLFRLVFCGTHDVEWKGTHKKLTKVHLTWELPLSRIKEGESAGQPFVIGKSYTFSSHEKSNLRNDMEGLYGKKFDSYELEKAGGFDLEKVVGRPCQIHIVYSEDGQYANIKALMPLGLGMECPPAINPTVIIGEKDWGGQDYMALSDKMREWIEGSDEMKKRSVEEYDAGGGIPNHDFDDDIPYTSHGYSGRPGITFDETEPPF